MSSRPARERSLPVLNVIVPLAFVAVLAFIAIRTWPAWEVLAFGAVAVAIFLIGGRRRLLNRVQSGLTDELQIESPVGEIRRERTSKSR